VNDGRGSVSEKSVHGVSFEKWDNRFLFITRTDLRKTIINLRDVSNRFNGENEFKFLSKPSGVIIILVIVVVVITNIVAFIHPMQIVTTSYYVILIGTYFVHK